MLNKEKFTVQLNLEQCKVPITLLVMRALDRHDLS